MPAFDLDDSAPFLVSNSARVSWTSGWDALLAASGRCIRVNTRGIAVKPVHWSAVNLQPQGWTSRACAASGRGLCDTSFGVCFPSSDAMELPAYDPIAAWGGMGCS